MILGSLIFVAFFINFNLMYYIYKQIKYQVNPYTDYIKEKLE